jgi:hypothetical protein
VAAVGRGRAALRVAHEARWPGGGGEACGRGCDQTRNTEAGRCGWREAATVGATLFRRKK